MPAYSVAGISIVLLFSKFINYELTKFIMKNHMHQLQMALKMCRMPGPFISSDSQEYTAGL